MHALLEEVTIGERYFLGVNCAEPAVTKLAPDVQLSLRRE
jgi:hypothetical protein